MIVLAPIASHQFGVFELHARIGLADHNAFARYPKLLPHPIGADIGQIPLRRCGRINVTRHRLRQLGQGAQDGARQHTIDFWPGCKPKLKQRAALNLQCVDQIIRCVSNAKLIEGLAQIGLAAVRLFHQGGIDKLAAGVIICHRRRG